MEYPIEFFGDTFKAISFYEMDRCYDGVDMYDDAGDYIGEMFVMSLPDEDDEESMNDFQEKAQEWLIDNY